MPISSPPVRPNQPRSRARRAVVGACLFASCAGPPLRVDRAEVGDELVRRADVEDAAREAEASGGALPPGPGLDLDDDVTRDEAVVTALARNPGFRALLAQLGVARAEVAAVGGFQDPGLTFLVPTGPKLYEWTLRLPLEDLWLRSGRIDAALDDAERLATTLVASGLDLVRDVETDLIDAGWTRADAQLARELDALHARQWTLLEVRVREGELAPSAVSPARRAAALARADAAEREGAARLARARLFARLGLDRAPSGAVALDPLDAPDALPSVERAVELALAGRPEVHAAELALTVAAQRAGLTSREGWHLVGLVDANEVDGGMDVGPGLTIDLPLFSGRWRDARAKAQVELAEERYRAAREQVALEVRLAHSAWAVAQDVLRAHHDGVLPALERAAQLARAAHEAGEGSAVEELDARLDLVSGRRTDADLEARLRRARVTLERAVGERLPQDMPTPKDALP